MLQLQTKKFDVCQVSKLLVKYKVKASISDQVISLEGEISEELLNELCNVLTICNVQNFCGEVFPTTLNELDSSKSDESSYTEEDATFEEPSSDVELEPQYDLRYPTVKRAEVYICDFGQCFGSEQGKQRYAIVVQNDYGNIHSATTIVIACSTKMKKILPVHHYFTFSNQNMIDYDESRVGTKPNVVMAEQLRTIDKKRLRKYLGTMTPEFMDKIQEIIDVSLDLRREEKVITKTETVYVDKPVYINVPVETNTPKDLNKVQIQLLSLVDVKELFKIAQSTDSNNIKVQKILDLFGFDMQKNGMQYLFKAILISPKGSYFNLESLCDSIAKSEPNIEKDEIKRLIVARIKEQFKFKKSPTIDFIRLVNVFLI